MAESVLADHDGTQAKKVMKVKAKRKSGSASITPSSRDPDSSPERAPVDAPPPLDPTHSYMEDCVAFMKHAIDTAAGRMAFPAARREKVIIELVNIGMHFGLEGLDGVLLGGDEVAKDGELFADVGEEREQLGGAARCVNLEYGYSLQYAYQ